MSLKTSQIGRCGEMLVQYLLLLRGVESAPMTTDAGVDLVAYSPQSSRPATIQVKTNLQAKRGGGKGSLALDWWIAEHTPSELVALVDLYSQRVWLFTVAEIAALAQQKSSGRYHLYMYLDPPRKPKRGRLNYAGDFERFLLSNRADEIFGTRPSTRGNASA